MTSKLVQATVAMSTLAASMGSYAVYDVTAVTSGVADSATAVLQIGAAVVLVVLGIKVFKWIARAL